MPELPEVVTVRQGLADVLEGRRLHRVQAMRPDLRFPLPENFEGRLSGRQVEKLARRGKYLLIHLQERLTLIAHLGMSGRFRIFNTSPPPLERHDHVVFEAEGGISVRFNDPRRF